MPDELTAEDIARHFNCHVRTARRWITVWRYARRRRGLPRVQLAARAGRGRRPFVVDRASFEAWLLGTPASNCDADVAAND